MCNGMERWLKLQEHKLSNIVVEVDDTMAILRRNLSRFCFHASLSSSSHSTLNSFFLRITHRFFYGLPLLCPM
jgi:hypothetical protein